MTATITYADGLTLPRLTQTTHADERMVSADQLRDDFPVSEPRGDQPPIRGQYPWICQELVKREAGHSSVQQSDYDGAPVELGTPVLHAAWLEGDSWVAVCGTATERLLPYGVRWGHPERRGLERCSHCLAAYPTDAS
jgi:hypothetical protein